MSDDKLIPVKVAVRIRPLSKKENNEGCQTVVEVVENEPQVKILGFKPEWGVNSILHTTFVICKVWG